MFQPEQNMMQIQRPHLTIQKEKKSFLQVQGVLFAYGFGTSLFSPSASLYQLLKLNPNTKLSASQGLKLSMKILPRETLLKTAQMNLSTPLREQLNPWAAFALVGVLQGGIYGHANIFFARELNIGAKVRYSGVFRGWGYAGVRDMISQGMPYMFSKTVESEFFDKVYESESKTAKEVKRWTSVVVVSVLSTYISQVCQNCQITMHANQQLSHIGAFRQAIADNGIRLFYKGAEARVGLLLVVNLLNESILKKAWE